MDSGGLVTPPYVAGPLRLLPFRGMMLAPASIGDPASARAFARPYKDVAARLTRWERFGRISQDAEPALYLHEYTARGITIRGLVGALEVSRRAAAADERAILPHEGIYPGQADDLADRMAEMLINPAPILLVHRAPTPVRDLVRRTMAGSPDHDFVDRSQQQHRIWTIRDPGSLEVVASAIAGSRALIADGHHRYAAYLRLQQRAPGGPADQGLAMLVDQDDTPLFLGAIHRVLTGTSVDDVRAAAEASGMTYAESPQDAAVAALGPDRMVVTDTERWGVVTLHAPSDRAEVELLHERVVPALAHGPRQVQYHHAVEDALAQAAPGTGTAVLLPAPDVDLVHRIALADRLLPEKATSFQPKPSLGVLIRSLRA